MSFFDKILEKIGLKKGTEQTTGQGSGTAKTGTTGGQTRTGTPAQAPTAARPISEVDVVKQLEERARGTGLDWKVSIVDLLKLLDIDSSREARKELAQELGAPANVMTDSARMNTWLHKEVLRRIAQNGGNIPQNLLD